MTKLQLVKEGMFSTHYAIYEDNNYIAEAFAYAEDLGNDFLINLTWCFFSEPKEDLQDFIENNEYKLVSDIEYTLNLGLPEHHNWERLTRVIVKGEVVEILELNVI